MRKQNHAGGKCTIDVAAENSTSLGLGPVHMVSGTRDNPPPSYPGRAIFEKFYQSFT